MGFKEGKYCPGCGLANWEGLCPHCTGEGFPGEREPQQEREPQREQEQENE